MKTKLTSILTTLCLGVLCATSFRSYGACTNTVQNANDSGPGSLRAALVNANDGDTITFCPDVTGTIVLTNGELVVNKNLTILGPGANVLAVDGNAAGRVFHVSSNLDVTIAGLTITHGVGTFGGGILNNLSTLTVSNCTVTGNSTDNSAVSSGGGIASFGTITIVNCTLNDNSGSFGSALRVLRSSHIINSTISSNSGSSAIAVSGVDATALVEVLQCTLSGNAGGIYMAAGALCIGGTILNGGSGIQNVGSANVTVTSLGYNLSSDNGGGALTNVTDQINTDPMLGPLQNNGGPTFTHAPLCGSPAIDKGKNLSGSATDQRGAPRTANVASIPNAAVGDGTDIGAIELQPFRVTTTADSAMGSLRDAISEANAQPGSDIIDFDPGAYGTHTLTNGELLITDDVCIFGPGATNIAINGNYPNTTNRVFHIAPSNTVTIAGLTITNGYAHGDIPAAPGSIPGAGGGIYNEQSTLEIANCTLSGNSAVYYAGGIYNEGLGSSATLNIANSTLSGNSAVYSGGGIYSLAAGSASARLTIVNGTVSGNSSSGHGGGIYSIGILSGSATLKIANSTVSGNSANAGGGIYNNGVGGSATLYLGSTIFTNTARTGANILNDGGTVTSDGYNLSSDNGVENFNGTGALNATGDQTNTLPLLGPLQLNGGQTPTHALLSGSPAIDAGTNFSASATDQTGFPRTFDVPAIANVGDGTDIGAYELLNTSPVAQCTNVTVSAGSNCVANASINNGSYDLDGDTIITNQSPSGPYSLGTTTVTLTVTDSYGASNSCTATVTVVDITPPSLACPSNQTINATGPSGAVTNYSATASDACSVVVVTYDIAGTPITWPYSFPIGDTTVNVTATDAATNVASCSFTVHVKGAAEQINDLIAKINALPGVKSPNKKALVSPLQTALAALAAKDKPSACKAMQAFINLVKAQAEKKLISSADAAALTADALRIRAVIGCP